MVDVVASLTSVVTQSGQLVDITPLSGKGREVDGHRYSSRVFTPSVIEDVIDVSAFQVETPVEDYLPQGKHLSSKKEFKSLKDYIAYLLLLMEKIDHLEPAGTAQGVLLENRDEYSSLVKDLDALAEAEFIK